MFAICRASACSATRIVRPGGEPPQRGNASYSYAGLVGGEIVLHKFDLARVRKVAVGQILENMREIHGGMAIGHFNMAPAFQRCEQHEQIRRSIAFVLIVITREPPGFEGDRHECFGEQLLRRLIQAYQGALWIVGLVITSSSLSDSGFGPTQGVKPPDAEPSISRQSACV